MNTTAALFFLLIGQADGSVSGTNPGNVALLPQPYSYAECVDAGEAARANNVGLSYLSYTCIPAPVKVVTPAHMQVFWPASSKHGVASVSKSAPCDEVCELIHEAH